MGVELVVEDELSEALLKKVIVICAPKLVIGTIRVTNGFGQIKKNLKAFNNLAKIRPVVVLTDQDDAECAPSLIQEWMSDMTAESGLNLRVATREIESWVMADRTSFAAFLGVQVNLVPAYPDQIDDPKKKLLDLAAAASSRSLRKALLPSGSTARIGPGYNDALSDFVHSTWDPDRAQTNSESLARAIAAVRRIR
jgi:hypothetical protein